MKYAPLSYSGMRVKSALCLFLLGGLLSTQAMADRDANQVPDRRMQHDQGSSGQPGPGWQIQAAPDRDVNQRPVNRPQRDHLRGVDRNLTVQPGSSWQIQARPDRNTRQRPVNPPQRDTFRHGNDVGNIERFERGPDHYRSSNWQLDMRFQRDHYYPRRGSVVNVLPPGYRDFRFRGSRYYFQGGVWFRNVGANFVVTLPPIGIVIPFLPPDYTTLWLGPEPYYYANDVYYTPYPYGPGYVVADPPMNINDAVVVAPPAEVAPPAAAIYPPPPPPFAQPTGTAIKVVPSPGETADSASENSEPLFVYPERGQSQSRMKKDRNECAKWATEQTDYDPVKSTFDALQRDNYQAFVRTCLEGRGYSLK